MISTGAYAMPEAVVDTGPLIHLDEICQLELLLAVFSILHIPEAVIGELANQKAKIFISQHSDKIKTIIVPGQSIFAAKDAYTAFRLQLADLAVLALIQQTTDAVAVTDDLALRKAIEASGCTVIGTVGILFRAYKLTIINAAQLRGAVDALFDDSSLYLSSAFKTRIISMIAAEK
jgi:predicted nucleic acid-binding protein